MASAQKEEEVAPPQVVQQQAETELGASEASITTMTTATGTGIPTTSTTGSTGTASAMPASSSNAYPPPIRAELPPPGEEGHRRWKTLFGRDRYWRLIAMVLEGERNWRRTGYEERVADALTLPARGPLAKPATEKDRAAELTPFNSRGEMIKGVRAKVSAKAHGAAGPAGRKGAAVQSRRRGIPLPPTPGGGNGGGVHRAQQNGHGEARNPGGSDRNGEGVDATDADDVDSDADVDGDAGGDSEGGVISFAPASGSTLDTDEVTRPVVRKPEALRDKESADTEHYDLCFTITKTWSKERFAAMTPLQKVNFLPGHRVICVKTLLHKSIAGVRARNPTHWDFGNDWWPRSFCIPENYHELLGYWGPKEREWKRRQADRQLDGPSVEPAHNDASDPPPGFILKPPNAARGQKIRLASNIEALPAVDSPYILKETPLAQEYIYNPLLVDGYKCSFRIYLAITGVDPLRFYVYHNGLGRITHKPYSTDFVGTLNQDHLETHLTNCDIAKDRTTEEALERFQLSSPEFDDLPFFFLKTDIRSLLRHFERKNRDHPDPRKRCNADATWQKIQDVCMQAMLLSNGSFTANVKRDVKYRWNAYELLGADILLDDTFQPWLLEINHSPVLSPDGHVANALKIDMLRDLFEFTDVERIFRQQFYDEFAALKVRVHRYVAENLLTDPVVLEPECADSTYSERQRLLYDALRAKEWSRFVLLLTDYDIMALFHAEFEQRCAQRGGFVRVFPDKRVRELDLEWLLADGGRKQRLPLDRNFVALEMVCQDLLLSEVIDRANYDRSTARADLSS